MERLGVCVESARAFADHHAYERGDLSALAGAAEACEVAVTTEKDLVKLTGRWQLRTGVPLYALRIALQLDDEPGFLAAVTRSLEVEREA